MFRYLENTNLWKWFVALHCVDTKTNNFFLAMGFEDSYYTLVHWLKNRRCMWMQENQVGPREVLDFRVSRAIFNQKENLSAAMSRAFLVTLQIKILPFNFFSELFIGREVALHF